MGVEIRIAGSIVKCPKEGGEVDVQTADYSGKVKCPKFDTFCAQFAKRCPLDCMGNGLCMDNGTCQCLDGFTGKDCNTCPDCKPVDDEFVQEFNSGNPSGGDDDDEEESSEEVPACPRDSQILAWLNIRAERDAKSQIHNSLKDQYNDAKRIWLEKKEKVDGL